ncbi:uncharacterized protein LOC123556864 [Mercenaria mercenaria]|uniref:uncharacterized protein LOC123556864 n=1 Tax=Mercenaria mercenaria TaxID=6596 RepID=UPI00234F89DF|nr:uncharacterized protein LOC123556864 [Mercenaria mercenaria]
MAAPLKVQLLARFHTTVRAWVCSTRCMSSRRDGRDDGPPPWAARQVPGGTTFYGMMLSRVQHKEIWRKRMEYVNRPWKKTVLDYKKRQEAMAAMPPAEPTKLLMIRRRDKLWGVPEKEKKIIQRLGLDEIDKVVIVKNKKVTNGLLRKVKHLIEIFPVTFPYGLPESQEDLDHCYIADNGQFIVKKKLQSVKQIDDNIEVSDQLPENKFEMKQDHIDKLLEYRKMRYQINQEYFQTKYIYEKNQDGKEHRYKGDHNIGFDQIWH